jgi:dynein heavy chain
MQCDRLAGGLDKIAEAREMLTVLNEKLAVQKIAVNEKSAACEALLAGIMSATAEASEKKSIAEVKGKEISEQSEIIQVEKVSAGFTHGHSLLTDSSASKHLRQTS